MKKILALLALLFTVVFALIIFQKNSLQSPFNSKKEPKVTVNNHVFSVSVARKAVEKEVGLSGKQSIPQNQGMLFPFDKPDYYSFWMRNMKFPIDIIYINKNKIVTVYQKMAPPKNSNEIPSIIKPQEPADMVLEINSGLSEKYNIKKGDQVKIENL